MVKLSFKFVSYFLAPEPVLLRNFGRSCLTGLARGELQRHSCSVCNLTLAASVANRVIMTIPKLRESARDLRR
jgi:hypothetical protein